MQLIDTFDIKRTALVLRAVNHKLRQQLLNLIKENEQITVTEIYVRLGLEQSVASQHLAILRKAGMVQTTRKGKFIYYSLNMPAIKHLGTSMKTFLEEHFVLVK